MVPPLAGFPGSDDNKSTKEKINYAIKQVDAQRKELEHISVRIEERRRGIFDSIVRAYEKADDVRARVLSGEHAELQKVSGVVNASELALLHIAVRLETLRDVGDVMFALTCAFKEVKRIGKSVQNLAPNLEAASKEINEALSNVLAELGILAPSISVALTDTPQEIFEKAEQLINARTSELSELPKAVEETERSGGVSILEHSKRIALLASGGGEDEELGDEEEFKPQILRGRAKDPESAIRDYYYESGSEKLDVLDCSAQLNLPVDLIEHLYIKLLSEKKLNAPSSKPG